MHAEGSAKGKGKVKGQGKSNAPATEHGKLTRQQGGKGPQHGAYGYEHPDYFSYNCHNCGEKGRKATQGGEAKGKRPR